MKFLSLALLATPALTQSLKEVLDAAPHGKQFAQGISGDQKAQDALVPPGKSQVTLFLPTDKALEDHRSNAPRPGRKSKRELRPDEYAIAAYSSGDDKMALNAIAGGAVLKTQSADPTSGKANDIVAMGGGGGKLRLMARDNTTTPPGISVFGGLGAKANIVAGDFVFDKGVIHFVDTCVFLLLLLLIPSKLTKFPRIMDVPQRCSFTIGELRYNNFLSALSAAGLSAAIDQQTTTLLAYRDDVFTSSADKSAKTLQQHIIPNFIAYTPSLDGVQTLTTAANTTLKVSVRNGQYFINESPIVKSNIICNNGVVHTLGSVRISSLFFFLFPFSP